jgi:anaerobic selenocysteine-containing dehydrogenase
VGERGEGKWQRIRWEEAYDAIVSKFNESKKEYGPESVIFCLGTGRDIHPYLARLAYSFGSPNIVGFAALQGQACFFPRVAVQTAILGDCAVADCAQYFLNRYDNPYWKVPKCIIIWGFESKVASASGFLGHWLIESMKRGTEVIVVDPRRTWMATRAKPWLQIRPGTDAALALGMLNVIIKEKLYDEEFIRKWSHGFDALKERVQEYPPEKVAEITWIPSEKIIEASRKYATSKPAAIQFGCAVEQSKECTPTLHAITALWALSGNLDVPGGNVIRSRNFELGRLRKWGIEALTEEQKRRQIGLNRFPFVDWAGKLPGESVIDQMLTEVPYPIKAAWIQTANPIVCGAADARRTYEAFKKLDFNVVVDLFMTPTAMALADIVLPAATYPEKDGIAVTAGIASFVGAINKAIEPVGECKSDAEINLELGKKLNPDAWPWKDVREMFCAMIETVGVGFDELRDKGRLYDTFEYQKCEKGLLRPDKRAGFNTPTGKVELYSTVFEKFGLDALPYFEEPPESPVSKPEVAREFPLILTTGGRTWSFFLSEHRQIPLLRQMHPDPIAEVHPETAEKLGIKDGDWVYIENKYGKCKQRAKLTVGIHPNVVNAQCGWWFPEKPGPEPSLHGAWESNINLLLPSGWTGRSGFGYPFKALMCRVYKTEEP